MPRSAAEWWPRASHWQDASRILADATHRATAIAHSDEAPERARYDQAATEARSALTPEDWWEATAQGRALTLSEAADTALSCLSRVTETATATRAEMGDLGLLSPREQDFIRLIAEGMSDRQIGEALYISHRTVMRHVANKLAKLDVSSRGAASAWYTGQTTAP
jgi:DNA-binding NarL/FixJ family response regulator